MLLSSIFLNLIKQLCWRVGMDQFIGRSCLLPTVLMFLEYGLAIASLTYCLTFFFSDHSMAQVRIPLSLSLSVSVSYLMRLLFTCYFSLLQNVVLLVHFFTGLILMVVSFIMGLMQSTVTANSYLKVRQHST